MQPRPPVIIIGMHRAGTSMLTRSLSGLGLFVGRRTTRNDECRWTNALNAWVFRQASATWERPGGIDTLLGQADVRAPVADYLADVTAGPASARYLGLRRWVQYRSMQRVSEPWGWKDPRNTYTLPLWLDVFPGARVVHITRHGADVAASLQNRHRRAAADAARRYRQRRWLYRNNPAAPKAGGFAHGVGVAGLDDGMALWAAYTRRAWEHAERLGDQAMSLRYEDLLAAPREHLERVAAFCHLDASPAAVARQADGYRSDRAFAHERDPVLRDLAGRHTETLATLGYGPAAETTERGS